MKNGYIVALLAEGVDRNFEVWTEWKNTKVALLAEGVDRNIPYFLTSSGEMVALLAEGVDRNDFWDDEGKVQPESPSSRRAWIEMS